MCGNSSEADGGGNTKVVDQRVAGQDRALVAGTKARIENTQSVVMVDPGALEAMLGATNAAAETIQAGSKLALDLADNTTGRAFEFSEGAADKLAAGFSEAFDFGRAALGEVAKSGEDTRAFVSSVLAREQTSEESLLSEQALKLAVPLALIGAVAWSMRK